MKLVDIPYFLIQQLKTVIETLSNTEHEIRAKVMIESTPNLMFKAHVYEC